MRGCAEGEQRFVIRGQIFHGGGLCHDGKAVLPVVHLPQQRAAARVRGKHADIRRRAVAHLRAHAERGAHTHAPHARHGIALCLCRGEHGVQAGLRPGGLIKARTRAAGGVRQGVKRRAVKHPQPGKYGKLHALLSGKLAPAVSFARVHRRRARGNEASGLHPLRDEAADLHG